ncbi:MAG: hypothetical protein J6Y64_09405 [Ruminococcus sp.]|nr:hypothetical protein [Ruminococcus sp.]
MAHLKCKCGQIMWNGSCPNDIEFWVYSDKTIDDIIDDEEFDQFFLRDKNDYNVWKCPVCQRLYVFDEKLKSNKPICIYRPEKI